MKRPEPQSVRLHEDLAMFREAVAFTAAQTAFSPRLVEKDYFCTVLLEYLAAEKNLVFKGGTCIAKVHTGFYRLSEDLDFMIPTPVEASRSERSRRVSGLKEAVGALPRHLAGFRVVEPLKGANGSTQYIAVVAYLSQAGHGEETVKIEVGLREPLLASPLLAPANTLLRDPLYGGQALPDVMVRCLSLAESFAEKFRAALSRRDPAIRDFYDIEHAARALDLDTQTAEFVAMVGKKLAVPGNDAVDVSENRRKSLERQKESVLKPVLRESDYAEFDLDRAFAIVTRMADALRRSQR